MTAIEDDIAGSLKPRKMSMPNEERTPEMFEKRNGRSRVRTVNSHAESFRCSHVCSASVKSITPGGW